MKEVEFWLLLDFHVFSAILVER